MTTLKHSVWLTGLALLVPCALSAQTLSGRVVDERTQQPLATAQIFITGLPLGTLSQTNGRYILLNVPAGTHTVRVERIGYGSSTQEVTIAANQTVQLDFSLLQQALALDEIVVTGTPGGTQRRAVGNVVERINASAVAENAAVTTVDQMLGSRVPGLLSTTSSGSLGGDAAQIRIRGSSSSALSGQPIIYVDGIRINSDQTQTRDYATSRLNDINPADIESIEIIKGPAAATLYGTEASNGVIQIITKRGAPTGQPTFDASVELGASWFPDPATTVPLNYGRSSTGELISIHLPTAEEERFGKPFFQRGPIQKYGLGVRGGTDLIRYYASVNLSDQVGVVDWNWDNSRSSRISLTVIPSSKLNLDFTGSYLSRSTRLPGAFYSEINRGQVETAVDYGGIQHRLRGFGQVPEAYSEGREQIVDVNRTSVAMTVTATPFSWLTTRGILGTEQTGQVEHTTTFRENDAPAGNWGVAGLGLRTVDDVETGLSTVDLATTANLALSDRLGSSTSGGFQYYKKRLWTRSATGNEFATRALTTVGATARTSASEDLIENVTMGVYLQQQFDWEQRMFLTAAVRGDDNSAFGSDFNAAIYPKVSATWVVSEESFWRAPFVMPFRLRGAWGAAGMQPDVFAATRLFRAVTGTGDLPSLTPSSYGNPELGPERGEELEVGFDAGLLNDRVQLNFTHYWKTTKDAIQARAVPASLGFPGVQLVNLGMVKNWGMEAALDMDVITRDPVRWNMTLGLATMKNRIVDQGDIERIPVRRGRQHVAGYPLAGVHNIRVVSAEFVSGNSGPVKNVMCDGGTGRNGKEFGGPPVPCADAPRLYWGPAEPTWSVNLASTVTIQRNLRLYANLDARGGNLQYNDGIAARHTSWCNSLACVMKDDALVMGYIAADRTPLGLYDGGFGVLREVGVNYTIPRALVERIGAGTASVNVAARNLGYLWRSTHSKIGNEWVQSPETLALDNPGGAIGAYAFGGESHSAMPPTSHATVTMRVTF